MIKIYNTQNGKLELLDDFKPGAWIDIQSATKDDIEKIAKLTNLDVVDLDDSLDSFEVPRIERVENNTLLFIQFPSDTDTHTETFTLVSTDKYFITISILDNSIVDSIVYKGLTSFSLDRSRLILLILTSVTREFTIRVKNVRNNVLQSKNSIKKVNDKEILSLIENEEILNQYLSVLSPMKNVFANDILRKYIEVNENNLDYYEDMLISINQTESNCSVNLKSVRSFRDALQIVFTNQLNKTIRFLTTFTIIMTVPTMIAGLFGMNVVLPISDTSTSSFWIIAIIAISVSTILGILLTFKSRSK